MELRPMISSEHRDALLQITALKEQLSNFQDMIRDMAASNSRKDDYLEKLEEHINSLLDDLEDKRIEDIMLENAPEPPSTPFNPSRLPYSKDLYSIEEEDDRNYDSSGGLRRGRTRKSRRMRLKATRKRKHRKHKR